MAARDQHDRPALERPLEGVRRIADRHGAGRVGKITGHRGHDTCAGSARREHNRHSDRTRRGEEGEIGSPGRVADEVRRPGASQAVDDDVGDGRTTSHFFAKLSNTGRMRSSAFFRLASEFA